MAERGIPFCGEMVRAILEDRKTQTRRVIDLPTDIQWQYTGKTSDISYRFEHYGCDGLIDGCCFRKPRYQVGDLLWAKETWGVFDVDADEDVAIAYKADQRNTFVTWFENKAHLLKGNYRLKQWRSSRFMFKDFARIWRQITGLKVEHLQDISEEDAASEGVFPCPSCGPNNWKYRHAFMDLWDSLHSRPGERSADNPWVFAYEFKRMNQLNAGGPPK